MRLLTIINVVHRVRNTFGRFLEECLLEIIANAFCTGDIHDRVDCACFIPVFGFFQMCYGVRLDEVGWQNERKSWEKIVKKSRQ